MKQWVRLGVFASTLVGAAVIVAYARGPLDPPPGPVQPTGPSLADVMGAIKDLGGTPIGSPVPGDTLFAGLGLATEGRTMYYRLAGIQGEEASPPYVGWTEAISTSQALMRPPGGQASLSSFRILGRIDRSLPLLMQRALTGATIADASIDYLQEFPSGRVRYLQVRLVNPTITGVTPIYQLRACMIELNFTRVEWVYTPLDADGRPSGADVVFCWNVQSGSACN